MKINLTKDELKNIKNCLDLASSECAFVDIDAYDKISNSISSYNEDDDLYEEDKYDILIKEMASLHARLVVLEKNSLQKS